MGRDTVLTHLVDLAPTDVFAGRPLVPAYWGIRGSQVIAVLVVSRTEPSAVGRRYAAV
ncbi:hypothetical protein I547_4873 [Mycobacterium kansasii 824]|nr:hypothetical protein I547_4873 [Mycobacterium kansasii 824]